MTSRVKKRLLNFLRLAVCAAALWFVLQGVTLRDQVRLVDGTAVVGDVTEDGDSVVVALPDGTTRTLSRTEVAVDSDGAPAIQFGLKSAWRNSRKGFLLLALLIHFPVVLPQALRFRWLLGVQGIRLSYWECLKLTLAGNFLNFAAPLGSNAGDVFKAYFASLHTEHKTEAVTTVVLDRLIGLGTIVMIVTFITMFAASDGRLAILRPYLFAMVGVGTVAVVLYLSPWVRRYAGLRNLLARLPMFEHLERVDRAARTLARHGSTVVASVILTFFLQLLAMAAYFAVAVALRLEAGVGQVLEFLAYFYTGVVVQALPGPPQGLGTVELTYRYFFSPFGSPSQIVCMALAIRIVVLLCAMPGLLVAVTGSYKPGSGGYQRSSSGDPAIVEGDAARPETGAAGAVRDDVSPTTVQVSAASPSQGADAPVL
ncbi:MAG: flippase-like domain-containing protein [Planctomycetes bacterium]|nr:flippase-like domain-containing protein [Planctomycetota bacterium]